MVIAPFKVAGDLGIANGQADEVSRTPPQHTSTHRPFGAGDLGDECHRDHHASTIAA
jgi:hypothetical protein